jgi:hypothetical protein
MATCYRTQSNTVERFLLTSEGYLLSDYLLRHSPKCAKHRVPCLRTSKPRALGVTHFQLHAGLEVCNDYHL